MTREGFDGSAQERGLRELERRTGKRAKHLAAALDCDTQAWRRYFWGQQPLRSDMIPAVAAAYGVTTRELLEAVGLLDDQSGQDRQAPEGWDLRAELHAASADDQAFAERMWQVYRSRPYEEQLIVGRGMQSAAADGGDGETAGYRDVTVVQRNLQRDAL